MKKKLEILALLSVAVLVALAAGDALAAGSPFGIGLAEPAYRPSGPFAAFFAWIAAEQSAFYQGLKDALKAIKSDGTAGLWLVGLSFAYGVFHAAGPGHGKAVISSYVLANEQTARRGIALSFASAFAQAVTAVALIGVAAIVLNMTSIAITETTRYFELGSYLMVMAIGAGLIWAKILRPWLPSRRPQTLGAASAAAHPAGGHHHHHHHHHGHDHFHSRDHGHHHAPGEVCSSCGHLHAPDPGQLQGEMSIAKAWSVILAVGLRPCTGALVVLIFALAQGLVWAGVMATFAMALGTGITVAVLAGLAVGAKGLAERVFGGEGRAVARVHYAVEGAGAVFVFLLGATLFIAATGWGAA